MVIQINSFMLNFFIKSFITALLFAGNIFVVKSTPHRSINFDTVYYIKKPNFMQVAIKFGLYAPSTDKSEP